MAKQKFGRMNASDFEVPKAEKSNIALADAILQDSSREHAEISVDLLLPNPRQPRIYFDQAKLQELADDIQRNGLIEEVVVRRSLTQQGYFELICGERRTRACRDFLQWATMPAQIRICSDAELLRVALAENEQHEHLSPYERAHAYESLRKELGADGDEATIRELAQLIGKNKDTVQLHLNLLKAQPELQQLIQEDTTISPRIIDELRKVEDDPSRAELIRNVRKKLYNQDEIIEIVRQYRKLLLQKAMKIEPVEQKEAELPSFELQLAKRIQTLKKYDAQVKKLVELHNDAMMTEQERMVVREHAQHWIAELQQLLA